MVIPFACRVKVPGFKSRQNLSDSDSGRSSGQPLLTGVDGKERYRTSLCVAAH